MKYDEKGQSRITEKIVYKHGTHNKNTSSINKKGHLISIILFKKCILYLFLFTYMSTTFDRMNACNLLS